MARKAFKIVPEFSLRPPPPPKRLNLPQQIALKSFFRLHRTRAFLDFPELSWAFFGLPWPSWALESCYFSMKDNVFHDTSYFL